MFIIDDLPSAYVSRETSPTVKYEEGIPLGYIDENNNYFIYNHFEFLISIHETMEDKDAYRIVGFKVEPLSYFIFNSSSNTSYRVM